MAPLGTLKMVLTHLIKERYVVFFLCCLIQLWQTQHFTICKIE